MSVKIEVIFSLKMIELAGESVRPLAQGGNFHLKVGGPKAVAMLVTLCWGLQ